MYSDLVQSSARAFGKVLSSRVAKAGMLLAAMLTTPLVHSAWQDPLNTPAIQTTRAHETLMLDVVRAGKRLIAAGAYGHIVVSEDNGHTWHQGKVPVTVTLTALSFPSEDRGWAVGHDGVILRTLDGGRTWTKQFDGFAANKAIVAAAKANEQQAEAALEIAEAKGDSKEVAAAQERIENANFALGDAEYDLNTGSTKPFLDVLFYDARRGFAVGAYGMLFATQNGGETWVDVSARLPNPDRLHLNAIAATGGRSLMIVGEQGTILRSNDMGETWSRLDSPYDGSLFGLVANGNQQLTFGLRGHVFRSIDGGITWDELNTGSEQTILAGFIGQQRSVLVGNGGSIILVNQQFQQPKSVIIEGRKSHSGVVETNDGHYVLAGEAGLVRLNADGALVNDPITMASGDF